MHTHAHKCSNGGTSLIRIRFDLNGKGVCGADVYSKQRPLDGVVDGDHPGRDAGRSLNHTHTNTNTHTHARTNTNTHPVSYPLSRAHTRAF